MIADGEDVLIEIFVWLPVKSLIRFKTVCKRWLSLISSHQFSHRHALHHRRHQDHHRPEPSILLHLADTSEYFYVDGQKCVPYHFSPGLSKSTICSFSNGLFLLQCCSTGSDPEPCYVYNPTTKESRHISLNLNEKYRGVLGLNLAFDPVKSPYYKIICIRAFRKRSSGMFLRWWRRCQVEVYDSETSTWKVFGKPFTAPAHVQFNNGIYWNEAIHWRGCFFDLQTGVLGEHPLVVIPRVNYLTDDFDGSYIESNGHLCFVTSPGEDGSVAVFELQRDHSQWCLMYQVDLDQAPGPFSVLSVIRRLESEENSALMVYQQGKVMVYQFREKSCKEIMDLKTEEIYQEGGMQFDSRGCFQIKETLTPV